MNYDLPDHPVIQNMERTGYPDGKEPTFPICPVCGEECEEIFRDKDLNIVGCDICIKQSDAMGGAGVLPRKGVLMKGLVITTENKMQVREFDEPAYETIGKAVGGWIEVVHPKGLPGPFCMVVNEEGLLHGLPLNLFGCILYDTVRHGNPIVGDIVILKEGFTTPGERDFIGLDEDDVKFLGAMAVSLSGGGIKWESEAR